MIFSLHLSIYMAFKRANSQIKNSIIPKTIIFKKPDFLTFEKKDMVGLL